MADVITGSGAGSRPHVKVFDGATGAEVRSFYAYDQGFAGGVFVAAGDVNGDGTADVIVGSGEGRSGQVKIFSGRAYKPLAESVAMLAGEGLMAHRRWAHDPILTNVEVP